MRRKSFAIVAMLVTVAALMSSVIPSVSVNVAFAEEDNYSQDSSQGSRDGEDKSNHEEEEEEDGESARSNDEQDDDEEDSEDYTGSHDGENSDDGDGSEPETEQENRQKNVCSGWAVCVNEAENADDSITGAAVGNATTDDTATTDDPAVTMQQQTIPMVLWF
jgi:cytoskeletal protein RodZ